VKVKVYICTSCEGRRRKTC